MSIPLINRRGFTVLEVLIAALLLGIISTAAFRFYARMHTQSNVQETISEMQTLVRASMQEVVSTLRTAGFKLTGHPAVEIRGDTLAVYLSATQPVDTILYFLEEFTASEYQKVPGRTPSMKIWKLMKKINGTPAQVFADFIQDFTVHWIDPANIEVTITAMTAAADEDYAPNAGFRTSTLTERVYLRNVR